VAGLRIPFADEESRRGGGNVEPETGAEGERGGFGGVEEVVPGGQVFDAEEAGGGGECEEVDAAEEGGREGEEEEGGGGVRGGHEGEGMEVGDGREVMGVGALYGWLGGKVAEVVVMVEVALHRMG